MSLSTLLLAELNHELGRTRATLERVPLANGAFKPHEKSMALKSLAIHLARLPGFGVTVLTTPELRFGQGGEASPQAESVAQLLALFDQPAAQVKDVLAGMPEAGWEEPFGLYFQDAQLFNGPRFLAYRNLFVNHMVHHRAQLGVYLRLNGVAVPSVYGPSADENF